MDIDFICDYNFVFGDLNYRMNTTFSEMIYKLRVAP
jgi:hypothetical protein